MPIDLTEDLVRRALADPRVATTLAEAMRPALPAALAEREADAWLPAGEAARYLYGRDDREEAFRMLRARHPEIDAGSTGTGKLRRWKRAALDAVLASNPRIRSRT